MLRLRQQLRVQIRPSRFHSGPRRPLTPSPTVRHVRFKRPWLRSFMFRTLFAAAAFYLWSSYLLRFEDDADDTDTLLPGQVSEASSPREATSTRQNSREDEHNEEGPVFIPLTWSWLEEGELYRSSDPEWQEFLAALVLQAASEQLSQVLGGPISLTGFWLISDDGVAWVTRPIEPDVGDRLETLMKPVHVVLAMKDASLILVRRQIARLRGDSPHPLEVLFGGQVSPKNGGLTPLSSNESPKLQPSMKEEPSEVQHSKDISLHSSFIISLLQRLPLPDLGPGSDLHLASVAFQARLKDYRAQRARTPRRGTFFIAGPVGLKGPNGFCRFEVRGEYDPAKPGWRTIEMKLRDVNFRKQRPLR
ncbi:hypothetical protein N7468_001938 [Penicillium chermesinum]|uniref:Uncharacterized protein n=1 Tax=Penicillium chermesinum TaxID=63820 RepID=A0A9W9TX54_9EURO|nr:uncharacterized protein N7468_001938 [Penicillium chermesinum]KAJ5246955.1 hypothetical protein N7468_001938 [Penicillium chermesinum]